nr:MAG TPA: hypothetical protein [Bacteriophage sp.]DAG77391.1 MAG TPA: hypothetical protein [Caudoviricetes sp.]DAH23086.1 MAG TPA: hypothetical protein [Caudoviricetes sp.]
MATLKGSEKQVAWAKDIRSVATEALNDAISQAKKPETIAKFGKDVAKQTASRAKDTKAVINSTTSASQLIDSLGGYIGHSTGEEAKRAAMAGIMRTIRDGTSDFAKRLKKAYTGK